MKISKTSPSVVILANGEKPTHKIPLDVLRKADFVVCCDGAYKKLKETGREPDYVVGDCDSISKKDTLSLANKVIKISEQETNDLAKAFYFTINNKDWKKPSITILGACGLREDHTIGNVFRLIDFAKESPSISIYSDYGRFFPVLKSKRIKCRKSTPVSIFAPFPGTAVKSTGLKWKLDGLDLSQLYSATLNKTTGASFTISTTAPVIIYIPDE